MWLSGMLSLAGAGSFDLDKIVLDRKKEDGHQYTPDELCQLTWSVSLFQLLSRPLIGASIGIFLSGLVLKSSTPQEKAYIHVYKYICTSW